MPQTKATSPEPTASDAPSRKDVWRMFDRIAGRYDLLNRVLSMRQDVAWRRRLVRLLPNRPNLKVLDLATGTADVLLTMHLGSNHVDYGVGMDLSSKMLDIGRSKIARAGLAPSLRLVRGDATAIAAHDRAFDVVAIAFGIRNVIDVPRALEEMRRVSRPSGRVLILEFALPRNRLLKALYLAYFRHILPCIGGVFSGDSAAYRYLNRTVESFPYGETFCALMRDAGFRNVSATTLTFGIAMIYQGDV